MQPRCAADGQRDICFTRPGIAANLLRVDDDGVDNLAETKRGDRQVVAAQPQHRNADEQSRERGYETADQENPNKHRDITRLAGVTAGIGMQDRAGRISPDAHECRVAQRKLAGDAVDQIETGRENDVNPHQHDDEIVIVVQPRLHEAIDRIKCKNEHGQADVDGPRREFVGMESAHTFSIAVEPNKPEGLISSTRIRITNETASA